MLKWSEVHRLDNNGNTIGVLSAKASYNTYQRLCINDHNCNALAFITYKSINGKVFLSVREIRYK
jgi:hypothetical protein